MDREQVLGMLERCEEVLSEDWEGGGAIWALNSEESADAKKLEPIRATFDKGDLLSSDQERELQDIYTRNCKPQ